MTVEQWIRDTGERAISTWAQSAVVWLLAADRLGVDWLPALVASTVPPVLVVLMSAIPNLTYSGPVWWKDALCRIVRSAVQGGLGALIAAGPDLVELRTWQVAGIAAATAALTAAKTIIARRVPGTVTPASLAGAG